MNMKKLLAAVLALALMLAAAGAMAETYKVYTYDDLKNYLGSDQTSGRAVSGDTVQLMNDIEATGWHRNVPDGVIIDGGNNKLTIGASGAFEGDKYTVKNLTISYTGSSDTAYGFIIGGGTVDNVKFEGNLQPCISTERGPGLKVSNCVFSGNEWGIYTNSSHSVSSVTNCTFNSLRAVALYGTETFTGNTVNSDKGVSVATPNATIKNNTFTGKRALSISANGVEASDNAFLGNSTIEISANCNANLTGNYWGGGKPATSRIDPENTENSTIKVDNPLTSDPNVKNPGPAQDAPQHVDMPSTGDGSMLMLWTALLALCAGAALVMKRARA